MIPSKKKKVPSKKKKVHQRVHHYTLSTTYFCIRGESIPLFKRLSGWTQQSIPTSHEHPEVPKVPLHRSSGGIEEASGGSPGPVPRLRRIRGR